MKIQSLFNGERITHNDRLCSASLRSVLATIAKTATDDGWHVRVAGTREELTEIGAYEVAGGGWMLRTDVGDFDCQPVA